MTLLCAMWLLAAVAQGSAQELKERPDLIVQRQFDAYNRHDADGVVAAFAPDAEVRTLGDTAVKRGRAVLRADFAEAFRKAPKVQATLLSRMVNGSFVVDHERVTGVPGDKTIEAIGIYEVRDGAIRRVWWTP